jgi:hypothetical protein
MRRYRVEKARGLVEVLDQILHCFYAGREPHQPVRNAEGQPLLAWNRALARGRSMNN